MNVNFLNPFVDAAFSVLQAEAGASMTRGSLRLEKEAYVTNDVTVIISLIGRVEGNVFFSMSNSTAQALASAMLGEALLEFDMLAQSGIAELGNVIAGAASVKLSQAGYESTISPPTLLQGCGATISTLDYPRVVVPLQGKEGSFEIHLALREGSNRNFSSAATPITKNAFLG